MTKIYENFEIDVQGKEVFISVLESNFSEHPLASLKHLIVAAIKVLGDTIIRGSKITDNTLTIQSATPRHAAQLQEFLREAGLVRNVPVMRI